MDFSFSEEQRSLQELAAQILGDRVTPERLKQVEAAGDGFDRETWAELARANLLGVAVPERFGGSGFGFLELFLLLQEVGRAVAPVPVLPTLVLGALPIQQFGSAAQQQRFLPRVATGEVILSGALVEKCGPEPTSPGTRARRDGDAWILDGLKIAVPAAHLAERILVPARTGEASVGLFLLDPAAPGVAQERMVATNLEPQGRLELAGARVAPEDVLGDPVAGTSMARWLTEHATTASCAVQLGVSERALRMTADYVTGRKQFDRPVGSFQAVHQRAADAFVELEAMRLCAWQAASLLAQGQPGGEAVAIAKFWAAEAGHDIAYASQHLHGGIGLDVDYPLHRYLVWAKQIELTLGSAAPQLARLGDRIAEGA